MVHDRLENLRRYLPEKYRDVIGTYLDSVNPDMKEGMTELEGKDLYARIMSYPTKREKDARIEAHNTYVDIQFTLRGEEGISLFARGDLEEISAQPERDFYTLAGEAPRRAQIVNLPGYFTMLFPHEAHRPQESPDGTCAVVKKGVIKIKAECFDKQGGSLA